MALTAQEPPGTRVTLGCFILQTTEGEAPAEHQEQQPSSTSCCISAKTPFPKGTTGASLQVTPCETGPRAWRSQTPLLGFEPNLAIMNSNIMVHHGHCASTTYT